MKRMIGTIIKGIKTIGVNQGRPGSHQDLLKAMQAPYKGLLICKHYLDFPVTVNPKLPAYFLGNQFPEFPLHCNLSVDDQP